MEHCPIVYFDAAAGITFQEADISVTVHAKHPAAREVPVCYCFGYTVAAMENALGRGQDPREDVAAEVKAGHCACEVKNPKGACCLGDMARAEQRLRALATTR
jgi:hypothetical protein